MYSAPAILSSAPIVLVTSASGLGSASVSDNDIVQTLGYSVSGVGANTYRYVLSSTATVDSGIVFYGPGGSGRFIDINANTNIIDVTKWGAVGNGVTDDTAAITRAISRAASLASNDQHPLIFFPPREYKITTLSIPEFIDVDMAGASLKSSSHDFSTPILSIGGSSQNAQVKLRGLRVEYDGTPTHNFPQSGLDNYYAIRIINAFQGDIDIALTNGFCGGVQMLASGTGPDYTGNSHNTVQMGGFYSFKVGLDLRANQYGYTNENLFLAGNFQGGSAMRNFGSMYCVRFSYVPPSGYAQQNNNVFIKPSFQVGAYNQEWHTGLVVQTNYRVYYQGREYRATNSGTTGATPPTHTTGTASDGTITWEYLGDYRRVPVYHQGAGAKCNFYASRWETGIGPFAMVSGNVEGFSTYEYEHYGGISGGNAFRDIEDIEYATTLRVPSCGSVIYEKTQAYDQNMDGIHNLHHRAIGSASGWTIAGLTYFGFFTGAFSNTSSFPNATILCRDGIDIESYPDVPCVLVDVSGAKRFRIDPNTFERLGRVYCAPMNDQFQKMDLETAGTLNTPPLLITDVFANVVSTYDTFQTSADGDTTMTVVASKDVPHVMVGFTSCKLEGFDIMRVRDKHGSEEMRVHCPTTQFKETQRQSFGTPTKGFFMRKGEIITNTGAGTGNPLYWVVTTPGVLGPAFATGVAVIRGEIRTAGANTYAANAAGTTGTTTPTGVQTVSDGNLTWDYIAPSAVITLGASL